MCKIKPKVVHCQRDKYDVYVGRGSNSKFGNPFSHKDNTLATFKVLTAEDAVKKYEEWILTQPELLQAVKSELKNKILGCWCKYKGNEPCHGDILLRIANE